MGKRINISNDKVIKTMFKQAISLLDIKEWLTSKTNKIIYNYAKMKVVLIKTLGASLDFY